jgi:dihydrofolate synthase/folylpolyglutamate synthase
MLEAWLAERVQAQPTAIKMGLDRCRRVAEKLNLIHWDIPVVIVGGTNGKGSTLAVLQSIYQQAGYRNFLYTSPHIRRFNERIQLDGQPVTDACFMEAVADIEAVRGDIELTFFEWATLAALQVAKKSALDVLLLEVGLGGRLDVVNIVDSDLAVITSIALDHMEYLGNTRESIAREKAGIMRPGKPVVCGDSDIPAPIRQQADDLSAPLSCIGVDYQLEKSNAGWSWQNKAGQHLRSEQSLSLKASNVATALQACCLLQEQLPVELDVMQTAVEAVRLPGRFERDDCRGREWIFDVAHNPQAVENLASNLQAHPTTGKTWALFSALASKDVANMVKPMEDVVDHWLVPQLTDFRAAPLAGLEKVMRQAGIGKLAGFATVAEAVATFMRESQAGDRCVVFGSFVMVGAAQMDREKVQHDENVV